MGEIYYKEMIHRFLGIIEFRTPFETNMYKVSISFCYLGHCSSVFNVFLALRCIGTVPSIRKKLNEYFHPYYIIQSITSLNFLEIDTKK